MAEMMKIAIDVMGGDNAPLAPIQGGFLAAEAYGAEVVLVGPEGEIAKILKEHHWEAPKQGKLTIVHAPAVVDMHDDPARVLRQKPDSSMAVALTLVRDGGADAVVSAGSTGALLSGATLICKRIRGIRRGALAPLIPTAGGPCMLVDAGANTECTPEYLLQFAFLGAYYMEKINGTQKPRVGLVNNGAEDSKGDPLRKETYALLREAGEAGRLHFVGNVEARDVMLGACDVAVIDGFAGNILLKTLEGTAKFMSAEIKKVFKANPATMASYLVCKKGMDNMAALFDQDRVGGAPFLGISHPVIKAHGSSNEIAFQNAVRQAIAYTKSGMIEETRQNIAFMTVEKKSEAAE